MYKINFNHLYYFLSIAEEGSIVKAAKKLNITQPALSHQLRALEEDLGKKLFDRVGRRLVINAHGESVKLYAGKIFRHSEEMMQYLKSDTPEYIKIIKIGTVPWLSKDQVYKFLKPLIFSQHIKVQVYQKDLTSLLKDAQNNLLDIVLCDSPYSGRSKKLQGHRLNTDPIVCVSASRVGFKGKFPQLLNGKKIISYSESCMMADKIDEFINRNDLAVKVVGEFTDSSLIKVSIENGGIAGFLPLSVAKQSLKNKSLVKLGEFTNLKFSLWAITKKDYRQNTIIANLLNKYK